MIPDNVTLIVKAPNQQIDDQNVECETSWTIRQLKGHLSEVYPSKPRTDEQKIIYSGKLLDDNIVLKDVLRTYETEIVHTMHLVCTPKRRMGDTVKPTESTDGLRRRTAIPATVNTAMETEQPVETPRPETRQNDQNHSVEMQNYLSSYMNNYGRVPPYPNYNMGEGYLPTPNDPASLANHMLMMQQAYLQYMQQYANMWQGGVPPIPTPPPEAPAPPAPPVEDEEVARDWLEHLYAASRLALLCSLIYLYGSPARLLLVLLLAAAGYLHQIGFFRDLQVNPQPEIVRPAVNGNANIGQNANPGDQNANPGNQNANPGNQNANIGLQANDNVDLGNVNANLDNVNANIGNMNANIENVNANIGNAQVNVAAENQQSLLAITWMVFTTFFASLIPDNN